MSNPFPGANGQGPQVVQQIQVARPTLEAVLPSDAAEINASGNGADEYVRVEFRPVGNGVRISMTDDGSIVFGGDFVLPHDQIANPPSRLLIGVNPQQAVFQWFREQMGMVNPPRFSMCVKRIGVIDPMAGRELVDWDQLAEELAEDGDGGEIPGGE